MGFLAHSLCTSTPFKIPRFLDLPLSTSKPLCWLTPPTEGHLQGLLQLPFVKAGRLDQLSRKENYTFHQVCFVQVDQSRSLNITHDCYGFYAKTLPLPPPSPPKNLRHFQKFCLLVSAVSRGHSDLEPPPFFTSLKSTYPKRTPFPAPKVFAHGIFVCIS